MSTATQSERPAVSTRLVAEYESLIAQRKALEAKAAKLKAAESALKDQILSTLGRFRSAPVGSTGRTVEVTTVHQPEVIRKAYSYDLLKIVEAAE